MRTLILSLMFTASALSTPITVTTPIGIDGQGFFWTSLGDFGQGAEGYGTNGAGDYASFSYGYGFGNSAAIDGITSNLFSIQFGLNGYLRLFAPDDSTVTASAPLVAEIVNQVCTQTDPVTNSCTYQIDPPPGGGSPTPEPRLTFLTAIAALGVVSWKWLRRA